MNSNGEGFYITLPNDSSKDFENNPSEYTTRLPRWIQLNGEWETGLHSIAYTPWYIARHLDEPISFAYPDKVDNNGKSGRMKKHYTTVYEYVTSIKKSLEEAHVTDNEIKFKFELNGKVTITLSPGYKVYLRREQAIVLGFMTFEDSAEVKEIAKSETGSYVANLHRETNIYVYCDIVQPQIVGDKTVPLLGIVPSEKTTETYEALYVVENMCYIPIQTKSFQKIKILLRSSTNESIPFEYGRAAVTLHLKPLNYF